MSRVRQRLDVVRVDRTPAVAVELWTGLVRMRVMLAIRRAGRLHRAREGSLRRGQSVSVVAPRVCLGAGR
jgi:hypothetical protein